MLCGKDLQIQGDTVTESMSTSRDNDCDVSANVAVRHFHSLLHDATPPELDSELGALKGMGDLNAYIMTLRSLLNDFAKGVFSNDIKIRGVIAGRLKTFQANMQHLTWQIQQIANGDFTQRVDFLGEFSIAFNSMVVQLDNALTELRQKKEELLVLTQRLEKEVEKRGKALNEVQKSEAQFKYLAEHDPLTGALNRRSFFSIANVELEKSSLCDSWSSLAILDIDKFKTFNDTYGHLEGDAAIKHVTNISKSCLRQADFLGRYGGEEFVFLFTNADSEQGYNAAERIRSAVERTPFLVNGADTHLTVSIGVVAIPPGRCSAESNHFVQFAIGIADEALYRSKHNGRNMVQSAAFPDSTKSNDRPPRHTRVMIKSRRQTIHRPGP